MKGILKLLFRFRNHMGSVPFLKGWAKCLFSQICDDKRCYRRRKTNQWTTCPRTSSDLCHPQCRTKDNISPDENCRDRSNATNHPRCHLGSKDICKKLSSFRHISSSK